MKIAKIIMTICALALLAGCSEPTEGTLPERDTETQTDERSAESASVNDESSNLSIAFPETLQSTDEAADNETVLQSAALIDESIDFYAPITIIPDTSADSDETDVDGEVTRPEFEYEGIEYMWDIPTGIWDFFIDNNKNILLITNDGLVSPADYKDEEDVVDALKSLDSLEYLGRAGEDYYNNGYMYRYGDRILICYNFPEGMMQSDYSEPDYDPATYYQAMFFKPYD